MFLQPCPWSASISRALPCPSAFFTLQSWCVPEVGPASDHGSDLVHQRERSRLQSQLWSRTLYQLRSLRQSLRNLRDSDDTRLGWDPGPRHLCLSRDLGGPGPPSGPAHQARVSHPHPSLSRHLLRQLQRRHHRLSYRLLPGSGGRCSYGTPSRGMYGSTTWSSIRSRITMSRH